MAPRANSEKAPNAKAPEKAEAKEENQKFSKGRGRGSSDGGAALMLRHTRKDIQER